jgi:VCBS repeat-containing protein
MRKIKEEVSMKKNIWNKNKCIFFVLALCCSMFVALTASADIIRVDITGSWVAGDFTVNQRSQDDYEGPLDGTVFGVSPSAGSTTVQLLVNTDNFVLQPANVPGVYDGNTYTPTHDWYGYTDVELVGGTYTFGTATWTTSDILLYLDGLDGNTAALWTDADIRTAKPTRVSFRMMALQSDGLDADLFVGARTPETIGLQFLIWEYYGGEEIRSNSYDVTLPDNVSPVANADSYNANEDTMLTVSAGSGLLNNDSDADVADILTVTNIDTTGTTGTVSYNSDGSFSYDPDGNFESLGVSDTAADTFSYTVSDGKGGSDTAVVTITVNGANDEPVVSALLCDGLSDPDNVTDYTPVLSWTFSDVDGDTQDSYLIQVSDSNGIVWNSGQVSGSLPNVEYSGVPLDPNTLYSWSVRVWDTGGSFDDPPADAEFTILDIGLRAYDGGVIKIAVDHVSNSYPLRIYKNGTTYGVILVPTGDPDASRIHIQTASGVMALKKMR